MGIFIKFLLLNIQQNIMDNKIKWNEEDIEINFRIIDIYSHFTKHEHKHISTNKLINQFFYNL